MRPAPARGFSHMGESDGRQRDRLRRNRHAAPGQEADPVHGARAELPAAVAARRRQIRDGVPGGAPKPACPAARCSAPRSRPRMSAASRASSASARYSARRACCCPSGPEPFCLFLDELPACAPDVQKAFYSLLLERRLGEHALPPGTWVVAAGNRMQDRALVRAMSSALVNRVTILQSARRRRRMAGLGARATACATRSAASSRYMPDALMRPVPAEPVPFSTPRAWALLSRALDMAEASGILTRETRRALAFGRLSAGGRGGVLRAGRGSDRRRCAPLEDYIEQPELLPKGETARWFILNCIRQNVRDGRLARLEAARGQPLPAQPAAGASAHRCSPTWSSTGARSAPTRRCSTLLKNGHRRNERRGRDATTAADRATLARHRERPAHGHGAAAASCRAGGGGARQSRRARSDHGRVRVRAAGRQSGIHCAAEGQRTGLRARA